LALRDRIVSQFRQPKGLPGRLAGLIMTNRPSNRRRNAWTVELLALEPHHRVLEIGCGPGLALELCAEITARGSVVGIDHSTVMVERAGRRFAQEIHSGRVEIRLGNFLEIAAFPSAFDRIYSVNVVQFLPDLNRSFEQIRSCLAAGGRVATTYQPRSKNPTREQALEMAKYIETAMQEVGFAQIERHELPLKPVPAICVIGVKP